VVTDDVQATPRTRLSCIEEVLSSYFSRCSEDKARSLPVFPLLSRQIQGWHRKLRHDKSPDVPFRHILSFTLSVLSVACFRITRVVPRSTINIVCGPERDWLSERRNVGLNFPGRHTAVYWVVLTQAMKSKLWVRRLCLNLGSCFDIDNDW
jgi:hypothetical protein